MSKARRDKRAGKKWFTRIGRQFDKALRPHGFEKGKFMRWGGIKFVFSEEPVSTVSDKPEPKLTVESLNKVIEILKENALPIVDGCYQFPADPSVPVHLIERVNEATRLQLGGFKPLDPVPAFGVKVMFGGCRAGKASQAAEAARRKDEQK